ncbi:hypothetical protein M885DRAFT_528204 [Pelagophyceae sp. CCMP2097]|nr:hypothetical protein M885DRAFT_528204 [Pelagophyceae sp. CCMP2097]
MREKFIAEPPEPPTAVRVDPRGAPPPRGEEAGRGGPRGAPRSAGRAAVRRRARVACASSRRRGTAPGAWQSSASRASGHVSPARATASAEPPRAARRRRGAPLDTGGTLDAAPTSFKEAMTYTQAHRRAPRKHGGNPDTAEKTEAQRRQSVRTVPRRPLRTARIANRAAAARRTF